MSEKIYDQREDLYALHVAAEPIGKTVVRTERDALANLSLFLEALDEWGCEDNDDRAKVILDFQKSGYDLSAYREKP